jgi:ABC-type uncharacterized transport system substrate-binding protein
MTKHLASLAATALAALTLTTSAALAHPHVWVVMTSEFVYAPDGTVTGVRQAWTFDDMYSAYATQGLEAKEKGKFTREELAELAEVNISSLKEFDYFTFAKANNRKTAFADPKDYWLDYKDSVLTLRFTLPFKAPVKAKALDVEVYDPSYFVDFSFADTAAVTLTGAPAQCRFSVHKPADPNAGNAKPLNESTFLNQENYGAAFANKVSVTCP